MATLALIRVALCMSVAAALLAACGGPQPPAASVALTQSSVIPTNAVRGGSRQPAKAKRTLLYATGGCSGVCVIAYPSGDVEGSISAPATQPCSNSSGDVFVTAYPNELQSEVLEYAHGGTTPIATLTIPGQSIAGGCAVDPTTGDLAVPYLCPDCSRGPGIAIFPQSQGTPTIYQTAFLPLFCGYDDDGNLFVDSFSPTNAKDVGFAELMKGSQSFSYLTTPVSLQGTGNPWRMQWDGKYMTYEAVGSANDSWGVTIYRLEFAGSTTTVVGQTHFRGVTRFAGQSWIHGNKVFIPYGVRGNGATHPKIGVWDYPAGGKPIEILKPLLESRPNFQGVAVSIGPD
jgi:hypothetical protein